MKICLGRPQMSKMVMEYSVLYVRHSSGKHFHERSEAGFNVCLTLLQGVLVCMDFIESSMVMCLVFRII